MRILAVRRCYFPSEYLAVESTKNPYGSYQDGDGYFFYRDRDLKTFDEFSDPDILRVGDDYYLAGTTMHA